MKRTVFLIPVLAGVDQLIKVFIRHWPENNAIFAVEPIFEITHTTNTGAAFSLLSGHPSLIAFCSLCLIIILAFSVLRTMHLTPSAELAVICLFSGGIGNLIDRLLFGGVTDYIRLLFIGFPIFNFADILITLSIALLLILLLTGKLEKRTGEKDGNH